ncbi:MAG TPA: hypothetical protein VF041_04920 [Gemmatimonadaceae bacterium]
MESSEHEQHHAHLPGLRCHARLVLALESALLSGRPDIERLDAVVEECVANLRAQELTEEQVVHTMMELVSGVTAGSWSRCPEWESEALAAEVAARSAAAYRRLTS